MRILSAALAALSLATLVAVTAPGCLSKAADGESCAEDDDCSSKRCFDKFCAGSTCTCDTAQCNEAPSDDCDPGWVCVYHEPLISISIAGSDDNHNTCEPTCSVCPANMHCNAGQTQGLCQSGFAPPTVDGGGPYTGVAGQAIALHATASSPSGTITAITWSLPDTTTPVTGAEVSYVFAGAGHYTIGVTATDDHGAMAEDSAEVDVCGGPGAPCYDASACCGGSACTAGACQ